MALTIAVLDALGQIFDQLPQGEHRRVLALGYPDVLAPAHVLDKFFGDAIGDRLTFRDDGDEIAAWHGLSGTLDRVVETESLFAALDADLTVIDLDPFVAGTKDPGRLLDGKVLMTMVEGRVVYGAPPAQGR